VKSIDGGKSQRDKEIAELESMISRLMKRGLIRIEYSYSHNSVDWSEWLEANSSETSIPARYMRTRFIDVRDGSVHLEDSFDATKIDIT
jgi:hypothetical protein